MPGLKIALSDFGSAHRLIELFGEIQEVEFTSMREDVARLAPKSWTRRATLQLGSGDELIIGTGSATAYTDTLINQCKNTNSKAITLIDSWVNYEKRFNNDPDEILVTDPWARDYAKNCWPKLKIRLLLIDRSKFLVQHSGVVNRVILIGTPSNQYTIDSLVRHNNLGSCLCPEIKFAKNWFKEPEIIVRAHPSNIGTCQHNELQENVNMTETALNKLANENTIVLGRPSYAHYYYESIGVPAYFSEKVNELWKGPKFRTF
jgi:hypothetical protein